MLSKCLSSLRRTVKDACDVLVVDDCSPDEEAREATRKLTEQADGTFIARPVNAGFSHTVNVGLRQCIREERDAVLMNADIETLTDTWLDLMLKQPTEDGKGLASIVGALLLYPNMTIQHAGIYFCQPADDKVLTTDGYVPIGLVDPDGHALVAYSRRVGRIVDGGGRRRAHGYEFTKARNRYEGAMCEIVTNAGVVHVTPNHKMYAAWTDQALAGHAVYLMRRGRDWRVGMTAMKVGNNAAGPRVRCLEQGGDALWLLGIYTTKAEALAAEQLLAWTYGVPDLQFRAYARNVLSQAHLDYIWGQIDSEEGADELLAAHGRDPQLPLLEWGRSRHAQKGTSRRPPSMGSYLFEIRAANLMPGWMNLPTRTPTGVTRQSFEVTRHHFKGDVFSLDVPPHHAYVSNDVILGNSILYREFDHRFRYGPHNLPEARHAMVMPVTGALQFIRHECLMEIGVYDETFRMGWEDVDYNVRVWQAGKECIYQPGIRAIHHEGFFRGQHRKSKQVEEWQAASWHRFKTKYADVSFTDFIPSLV